LDGVVWVVTIGAADLPNFVLTEGDIYGMCFWYSQTESFIHMTKILDSGDAHEIWCPVVGYEGFYAVSNFGRVCSISRTIINRGNSHKLKGGILTPILNKGYQRVTMRRDGKTEYKFCHQMVAAAFIGPCPGGQEVRHKDGNRANPRLDNLEYGTRAQNIADCKEHGTFKNGAAHLTEELVREIAKRSDETNTVLGLEYGVAPSTIDNIRLGRTWKRLGVARGKLGPRTKQLPKRRYTKIGHPRGAAHKRAKLTEAQAAEIVWSKKNASQLATEFRVSVGLIHRIRRGELWKHLTRP
jgi:hypothetical protein